MTSVGQAPEGGLVAAAIPCAAADRCSTEVQFLNIDSNDEHLLPDYQNY